MSPLPSGPLLREQDQERLNRGQGQNFGCAVQKKATQELFAELVCPRSKNTLNPPPPPTNHF